MLLFGLPTGTTLCGIGSNMEYEIGLQHPGVATILHNLALVLEEMGKYEQAEPLYQRTLTLYEPANRPIVIEHQFSAVRHVREEACSNPHSQIILYTI